MTVERAYNLVLGILNKNQIGGVPPSRFNDAINFAQDNYISFLLGAYQQYQYGRPIARAEYGQTLRIRESLSPFIGAKANYSVNSSGEINYPADYSAMDAMFTQDGKKRIKYVEEDKLAWHLDSAINPISQNPVFTIIDGKFIIYPNDIGTIKLSYIRKTNEIKYSFILDGNNRPVYDPGTSVDPQWRNLDMGQVLSRTLSQFGVNLQAGAVMNYAQELKAVGP